MDSLSVTGDIKTFLANETRKSVNANTITRKSLDSIYTTASNYDMTLQEFIEAYPREAVKIAEEELNEWTRVMAEAALTGVIIVDSNGSSSEVAVTRDITDLLKTRVRSAQQTVEEVRRYAMTVVPEGESRRNQVVKALYAQAVYQGNTRALAYLIDRVDGRVTETTQQQFDYGNAYSVYKIVNYLFKEQLEVLNSGPGTKIVCCSRRAGKTMLAAAVLLINCLKEPNTECMYIGKTMELAEKLLVQKIDQLVDDLQLTDTNGKRLNWKKFENGSSILIRGLSNTKDPDMIRGQKAKIIVIDEFFHMVEDGLLEYMIQEVLEPMQMDYANDYTMLYIGTPPKVKGTYGEKLWKEAKYAKFHWTFKHNPYPKGQDKVAFVESKLKEKGLDWSSPYARREYLGEFVYDEDALLYPVYHTYNPDTFEPDMEITSVYCGIDYGVSDCNALVGVAWDDKHRCGFVFFESKYNRLQIDQDMSMLEHLKKEVRSLWAVALDFFSSMPIEEANRRIRWSADSSDQQLTQELMYNVAIPDAKVRLDIVNAHKTDKTIMNDKIRDLLRTGNLLLPDNSKIVVECDKTILKRADNGAILQDVDDDYYHPDLLPALRYALWDAIGLETTEQADIPFETFMQHDNTTATDTMRSYN